MPARIQLANHLMVEELEQRYRTASRPVEVKHRQVILLYSKGWHTEDIAETLGYTTISLLARTAKNSRRTSVPAASN